MSAPVLVVLMGLPAVGKSTLCRRVLQEQAAGHVRARVVCYDDLFDEVASNDGEPEGFDVSAWHQSRVEALGRAAALLRAAGGDEAKRRTKGGENSKGKARSAAQASAEASSASEVGVVLLDDNFHFRSMRRQALRVAREAGAGYLTVWVRAPLDVALSRNAQRTGNRRVPEASLARIHDALEPPAVGDGGSGGGGSQSWESNFQVVLFDGTGPDWQLEKLWAAIHRASLHPVPAAPPEVDEAMMAASRAVTDQSTVHQADLTLRKLVAVCMQTPPLSTERDALPAAESALEPEAKRAFAALLNDQRKLLLDELRQGTLVRLAGQDAVEVVRQFPGLFLRRALAESELATPNAPWASRLRRLLRAQDAAGV